MRLLNRMIWMSGTYPAVPADEAETKMIRCSFRDVEIFRPWYFDETLRIFLLDNGSGHIRSRMGVEYFCINGIDAVRCKMIEMFCSWHFK